MTRRPSETWLGIVTIVAAIKKNLNKKGIKKGGKSSRLNERSRRIRSGCSVAPFLWDIGQIVVEHDLLLGFSRGQEVPVHFHSGLMSVEPVEIICHYKLEREKRNETKPSVSDLHKPQAQSQLVLWIIHHIPSGTHKRPPWNSRHHRQTGSLAHPQLHEPSGCTSRNFLLSRLSVPESSLRVQTPPVLEAENQVCPIHQSTGTRRRHC
ncbi:hypothetical protein B0J13DRAFT_9941 [Dactylonectria estremocensis]|uniref:Uncharacterized protein n=1 Tax=Dactylonectria estremocensis TaxID=1079267 RepID=A0A9P9FIC7_9HYPO|nr:hypothetical protein B0J13DRAFT_9941 [Dactylonectria estremocensis]